MRAIVTGGCGFIGSHLVRYLLSRDWSVFNMDALTYAGNPANLADVENHENYRFRHADICDRDAVSALLAEANPDVIFHLAAESHVDRSIDSPHDFVKTNVVGTVVLLEEAMRYCGRLPTLQRDRFRFLHVSTDEVFGTLNDDQVADARSAFRPNSPYAASKAASDHFVRAWNETYGLPTIVANCSNNYGPYQFPEKLLPMTILAVRERAPIPVYGRGTNQREWIYVDDHVSALLRLAEAGRTGATYTIGSGEVRTNIDIVHAICALMDELSPVAADRPSAELIEFVADRPAHDLRYALDSSDIRVETGWAPRVALNEGLRRTVSWYLSHEDWWRPIRERVYGGARLGLPASNVTKVR